MNSTSAPLFVNRVALDLLTNARPALVEARLIAGPQVRNNSGGNVAHARRCRRNHRLTALTAANGWCFGTSPFTSLFLGG
jgi:hypothetical protein